ncbi:hypothetical protein EV426DRAFT_573224 [Tirmania nivea]|nr:hypothetical protein EV426DRAFT_573224 [Tirmania nivea]
MTVAPGKAFETSSRPSRLLDNISTTTVPSLPLVNGDSYTSELPTSFTRASTTLAELAHLAKLQAYQEEKHHQHQDRLYKCLISNALSVRLTRTTDICHTILVDHLKSDEKKAFATLYTALHDVRNSCEATRRFALLETELEASPTNSTAGEVGKTWGVTSWLHDLPRQARETILSFISTIRSNPHFVASRLARLSSAELEVLAKFHQPLSPPDSVIANPRRGPTIVNTNARSSSINVPSPVERLLSFHRNDPLYTLLHSIFANSMGPDTAEDKRRTDMWATIYVKLLNESKGEQFFFAILDSWAAMREWPAKSNMETCLMALLQEGAFLLDKSEDQTTGKLQQDLRGKSDLMEEFLTKGVRTLFKVLDGDLSAGGIPEGVLELGHAIFKKVDDPKRKRQAEMIIMVKWFFGRFLMSSIQYPEYHGIMVGYHISEHARLKILRPLVNRMTIIAYNVMWAELKQTAPVEPSLKSHIESLLARLRACGTDASPVLLPSKSITSPPETLDIQPFIVICPADVLTLYNALFPPAVGGFTESRDIKRLANRPSRPFLAKSTTSGGYEIGSTSVLSNSSSSVTSDSASIYAPLLERSSVYEEKISFGSQMPSPSSFTLPSSASIMSIDEGSEIEKLGTDIRTAVESMRGRLAPETILGRCHPCAEKWAVLFISKDGNELSLKMQSDWEDEDEDDDNGDIDYGSDDEGPSETAGLDTDYHQLKESIKKLLAEYEIPENLTDEAQKFSNRTNAIKNVLATTKKEVEIEAEVGPEPDQSDTPPIQLDPSNPYYPTSNLTAMFAASQKSTAYLPRKSHRDIAATKDSALVKMLSAAYQQCLSQEDYVRAQQFHRALSQLEKLPPSLARDGYKPLLHIFARGSRVAISKSSGALEAIEAWFVWLTFAQERQDAAVKDGINRIRDLRDKMWYVTDVRNSATYEEAKGITMALKKMVQPVKQNPGKIAPAKGSRTSLGHRISTSNISLLKSDTLMDILAAPVEHGGPNKLSDEQADITATYLSRFSVENFCKGEERIHRFCYEIDKCVSKLVGDGILDSPVLWSSELFSRDDRDLATGGRKGEVHLPGLGTLSLSGDHGIESDGSGNARRGFDLLRKPSASDLLSLGRSRLSSSGTDIPSSRSRTRSTSIATLDSMMDQQDLLGVPSPKANQESTATFWSPFASLASASRAKTPHSPAAMMIKPPEEVNEKKRKFLLQLKQNLTGLLLSDFGTDVFSQGSETDAWFSGGLGDECIQRKEEQETEARKKLAEKTAGSKLNLSGKKMSRKKSMKSLRRAATHNSGILEALGKGEKGELAAPIATLENVAHEPHSGEENSSSSEAAVRVPNAKGSKKGGLTAFPYNQAFKSLLNKFSVHPNPYQKLYALYELELLIVASLSPTTPKFINRKISNSPLFGSLGEVTSRITNLQLSQPTNLEGVIASVEERRSHVMSKTTNTSPFMTPTGSRSPTSVAPSTDMIVEVLQNLFRQADIRPRTLFRDLQYVAAFVPASILDMTEIGKAFWDTGLAALGLKQDVCRTMVEIADEIIAYHTKKRQSESKSKNIDQDGSNEQVARYSMKDAARMLTITAMEGDPTAQRELAIFYLTNPSLLPRSTKPLSRPKDTFRPDMMVAKGEDPEKRDPATMCVSYHWMELSSQGGDELAKKYLQQRNEGW